jgi:drug/metabolite transporter (DMT)-like permease
MCALIWGSTWVAIKVGYEGLGAFHAAALRFGLSALLIAALMVAWRLPFPRSARAWRLPVAMAVLLFLGDYGLIYWGEQRIDSGLTAVLFATFPLFVALVGRAGFGEAFTAAKAGGIALGIVGLAVVFADSLVFDPARLPAMAAIVGAALSAAVANQLTHRDGRGLHPATYTAPGMALGALLLEAVAVLSGERLGLPSTTIAWASVLFLAVVGSVVAFLAFFWLQQRWGATRSAVLILLTPLVALFLGAALRSEQVGLATLAGTALVLVGVAATLRGPSEPAEGDALPQRGPEQVEG